MLLTLADSLIESKCFNEIGLRLDLNALAYVLNADNFSRISSCSNVLWMAATTGLLKTVIMHLC